MQKNSPTRGIITLKIRYIYQVLISVPIIGIKNISGDNFANFFVEMFKLMGLAKGILN